MSLPASNLYFASPHPWSAAIRSFSDLSFMALVLQISDAEDAFTKLRFATERSAAPSDQMAVAQRIKSVFSGCVVIDATPSLLKAIDRKTLHAATIHIRKQFMDMSVNKSLELLRGLLTGSPVVDATLPNTVRTPKMRLSIHARNGQSGQLQILLSATTDTEVNPPIIGSKHLRSLLDSSAQMLVGVGLDGRINYLNQGMADVYESRYFDRKIEISEILTPESSARFTQISTIVSMSNDCWFGFLEFAHPQTGMVIPCECRVSLVYDTVEQRAVGYVITARREEVAPDKLSSATGSFQSSVTSAQYEMVGKIAADMIYDVRSALQVIQSRTLALNDLATNYQSRGRVEDSLNQLSQEIVKIDMMRERIQRVVALIDDLSQDGNSEKIELVDLSSILAEVSELVEFFSRKHGVFVEIEKPQQKLCVPMQRLRISQVLTNLIMNSCEAIAAVSNKFVKLSIVCDDEWLYLLVTDSGPSIPHDVRVRLFEPHFSTKKDGIRTGFGLFSSRQVARAHGGDLYFDDTSEQTRFVLELPLLRASSAEGDEAWEEI